VSEEPYLCSLLSTAQRTCKGSALLLHFALCVFHSVCMFVCMLVRMCVTGAGRAHKGAALLARCTCFAYVRVHVHVCMRGFVYLTPGSCFCQLHRY